MKNLKNLVISGTVAIALVGSLAACTSGNDNDTAPKPTATTSAPVASGTPAPGPSEAPKQEFPVGTVVDPETSLSDTQSAYPLADGSYVVVDQNQPLPENVQADVNARTSTTASASSDASNVAGRSEGLAARTATKSDVQQGTGKRVVVAWDTVGLPYADTTSPIHFWAVDGLPGYPLIVSRGEVQAKFDAFVATQDNPAEWVLVFAPAA
jgi:hypothetical protein